MMTVLERMKARLSAVGVYDAQAQALSWELKAYAAGIEYLYTQLEAMFRERFIISAQDEGLQAYERMFGPERTDLSVEQRREMLLLRMSLGDQDFTPAGLSRALDSFGFAYTISEFPYIGKMNVTATTDLTPLQQAWIKNEVKKIIPAHIEFQLTFNTMTWDQWDALDRSFQSIDAEDQTWQQIDNRED